ncbi:MAG: biopolymer transporter ExbB [Clostridiales bacterium]|nr:MAG: biopolymer transporter ExbB [Clostridiales bacterium]
MDFSLLIGIIVGIGAVLLGFTIEGGALMSLLLISPIVIVLGGTIGATLASFSIKDIGNAFKALAYTFSKKSKGDPNVVIEKISSIAEICRRDGLLKIEDQLKDSSFDKDEFLFLKEGLILVMDGRQEEEIQYILESDIGAFTLQKQLEINVFESAAGFCPTMGVLGTVMGLVNVLANMGTDAAELAASIATAFVATLYGVGIANLVFMPIATKLKADLKRQKIQKEMIMNGVCMIVKGEASRNIANQLSLYYQAFPGGKEKYKLGINN